MHWRDAVQTHLPGIVGAQRLGLITDFDGTISPIVAHRDQAAILPRCREQLEQLQPYLTVIALVSGRGADDLAARAGLDHALYVGSHGFEQWQDGKSHIPAAIQPYRANLDAVLNALPANTIPAGVEIENKSMSIAVHYRNAADPDSIPMLHDLLKGLAAANRLQIVAGRMVYDLRPDLVINKGTSLRQIALDYRLDGIIFMGDDTTDMDAMAMLRQLRNDGVCSGISLGVLSPEMPPNLRESADIWANNVDDVAAFLEWLLSARRDRV